MFKLITVAADEIRLDEVAVSEMLTAACRRGESLWIEGAAADGDKVWFICGVRPEQMGEPRYRLSQLQTTPEAEFRGRYDAGFRTVGGFRLADGFWILTEITEK